MHLKVKVFSRCYNVLKQMPGLTFTSSLRQGVSFFPLQEPTSINVSGGDQQQQKNISQNTPHGYVGS